jgi:hypothetical protein
LRDLVKKLCTLLLIRVVTYIEARPGLRDRYTGKGGKLTPDDRMRALYVAPPGTPFASTLTATAETVTARKIHEELKVAIAQIKDQR